LDQLVWGGVFVAADDAAAGAVGPGQPVEPVADQGPVHGGGVEVQQVKAMRAGPQRRTTRTLMMRRSMRVGVRRGLVRGRLERSLIPAAPATR
jgi:hypothetical protein